MRRTDRNLVRALPLFRDVAQAHFDELMCVAFLQQFPSHVTLTTEGELPDFLYIVLEGSIELYGSYKGRETTLDIIRPVTTLILAAVIRGEVNLNSARTLTSSQILMIPAETVRKVFSLDAAFACAVGNELAIHYRGIVRKLKDLKLRSGAERLANWILETDRQQGRLGHFMLTYDKKTLAARLGMTPENLSRNLADLRSHGVAGRGREIVITDRKALRRRAEPDPLIDG